MPVKVAIPSSPPFSLSLSLSVFVYVSLVSLDQPPLPEEGRGVWEGGIPELHGCGPRKPIHWGGFRLVSRRKKHVDQPANRRLGFDIWVPPPFPFPFPKAET